MMTSTHTPQMGHTPVGARLVAVGGVSVGSWRCRMPISATNHGSYTRSFGTPNTTKRPARHLRMRST
jgi:hypothetical protein